MPRWLASRSGSAALAATALSLGVAGWIVWIGGPEALRERYGPLGPLVSVAAHTLVNLTPASDLVPWALANGALYGVALGATFSWLAWLGAAAVHWEIAHRAAAEYDVPGLLARLPRWLQRVPVEHPLFLIAARSLPTGALVTALVPGALGVSRRRVLACAAVGSVPPSLALAAVGSGVWGLLS